MRKDTNWGKLAPVNEMRWTTILSLSHTNILFILFFWTSTNYETNNIMKDCPSHLGERIIKLRSTTIIFMWILQTPDANNNFVVVPILNPSTDGCLKPHTPLCRNRFIFLCYSDWCSSARLNFVDRTKPRDRMGFGLDFAEVDGGTGGFHRSRSEGFGFRQSFLIIP